MKDNLSNIF